MDQEKGRGRKAERRRWREWERARGGEQTKGEERNEEEGETGREREDGEPAYCWAAFHVKCPAPPAPVPAIDICGHNRNVSAFVISSGLVTKDEGRRLCSYL